MEIDDDPGVQGCFFSPITWAIYTNLYTPETPNIDLLMRSVHRAGDTWHWLEKVFNWLASLFSVSEEQ